MVANIKEGLQTGRLRVLTKKETLKYLFASNTREKEVVEAIGNLLERGMVKAYWDNKVNEVVIAAAEEKADTKVWSSN